MTYLKFRISALIVVATLSIACSGPTEVIGPGNPKKLRGRSAPVSRTFGPAETRELYRRITSSSFRAKLKAYTCGDAVPPFDVTLAFWPERKYNERLVFIYTEPELGVRARDLCLALGFAYEVDRELARFDRGPMPEYTVRDPETEKLRRLLEVRHSPREPICDCSRRGVSDGSWVDLKDTTD